MLVDYNLLRKRLIFALFPIHPDKYRDKNVKSEIGNKQGPLAEWLGTALQKLLQRFESARDL